MLSSAGLTRLIRLDVGKEKCYFQSLVNMSIDDCFHDYRAHTLY